MTKRTKARSQEEPKRRVRGGERGEREKERKRGREYRGLVRSASPTAGWVLGYTRKRSVVLGPSIRRGWLGGEELSAPLKSVGTVCN